MGRGGDKWEEEGTNGKGRGGDEREGKGRGGIKWEENGRGPLGSGGGEREGE